MGRSLAAYSLISQEHAEAAEKSRSDILSILQEGTEAMEVGRSFSAYSSRLPSCRFL
jgi:hypothetical protein